MIKFFKILEKIVWSLVIIAIIIVLALVIFGIIADPNAIWARVSPFVPYFYLIAAIFVGFKAAILVVQIYMEGKIEEKTQHLQTIIEEQRAQQIAEEQKVSGKLDKIIDDITSIPNADTLAIVDFLKTNLPNVVSTLVDEQVRQQVAIEKQMLAIEYDKKESELKRKSLTVDAIIEREERIQKLNDAIQLREQQEREERLKKTEEYTMLIFSLAKTPVEDVEKVCQVTKLFIESGHVVADKEFKIAHNKKLRNAELWQFAKNIVKYNQKENLDVESYLMIVFGEWFTGSKENFAKNYSVLPKDSLVSKEGVDSDLFNLRKMLMKR